MGAAFQAHQVQAAGSHKSVKDVQQPPHIPGEWKVPIVEGLNATVNIHLRQIGSGQTHCLISRNADLVESIAIPEGVAHALRRAVSNARAGVSRTDARHFACLVSPFAPFPHTEQQAQFITNHAFHGRIPMVAHFSCEQADALGRTDPRDAPRAYVPREPGLHAGLQLRPAVKLRQ